MIIQSDGDSKQMTSVGAEWESKQKCCAEITASAKKCIAGIELN